MKNVIHIFGASGSGTTTLGKKICEELGYKLMDTDDYFWVPTEPKYTLKRPLEERIELMKNDIENSENVVISGSITDWGDVLIPYFSLAVRIEIDPNLRIERLVKRESERYGLRIAPTGDMYQQHLDFVEWAKAYDHGGTNIRSKAKHDEWQKLLPCEILHLDGADTLEKKSCQSFRCNRLESINKLEFNDSLCITKGIYMKVLVFLAKGFETMEFSVFVDVMGWARNDYGCDITVDTCGFRKQVVSTFGIPVLVNKTIDEICADDYDALAIPGGFEDFGFYEEAYAPRLSELIRAFRAQNKPIASICVAALALAKSGILTGKRATTYHLQGGGRQKQLAAFGVEVVNEPVVETDNIITSYCPQTAPDVAFRLLEKLAGSEMMHTVKAAMGYE